MKNALTLLIFCLLVCIHSAFGQGDAPPALQGQAQSTKSVATVIELPANQVTKTAAAKARVETGNNNILSNPSFEHLTYNTSWTTSGGTPFLESTLVIDGKKAFGFVASGTVSIRQDSSVNGPSFAFGGVQGLGSVWILTSVQGLYVCPRLAGVSVTSNFASQCYTVKGTGQWELAKIPFIFGITSNGIEVLSSGSVAGNIYIDDAFVGPVDLKVSGDSSKIVGESYFQPTASCVWTRASSTIGAFGAVTACPGPTLSGVPSMGTWDTTDTNLPKQTISNLPAGKYRVTFSGTAYINSASYAGYAISDGTTVCKAGAGSGTGNQGPFHVTCYFEYTSSGTRTFELYGGTISSIGINVKGDLTSPDIPVKFQLEYFSSGSTYSSTNANTEWAPCVFSTLAWGGMGTVTSNLQCRRDGSELVMNGRVTTGTVSAAVAAIPLPLWNGVQLTTATLSGVQSAGRIIRSNASSITDQTLILGSGLTTMGVGIMDWVTNGPLVSANVTSAFGSSEVVDFENVRIPIAGWAGSNIMIGQFNGLESCATTEECTDTYSAYFTAAGVVTENEGIDWVNGTTITPATSTYTIPFVSGKFTATPRCWVEEYGGSNYEGLVHTASTSGITVQMIQGNTVGTNSTTDFTLFCKKTGADHIGKTAKAVASDQSISTPGTLKMRHCSWVSSDTGVISNSYGDCNPSVSYSGGTADYTFPAGKWAQAPNCFCNTGDNQGGCSESSLNEPSTTNFDWITRTAAAATANVKHFVNCWGPMP